MAADHSTSRPYRMTHKREHHRGSFSLDTEAIILRYLAGESTQAIADSLNVSRQTVANRLYTANIRRRRGKERVIDMDEAIRRYEAGDHPEQIGKDLGLSAIAMRQRLINAGIKIRSPAEAAQTRRIIPPADVCDQYRGGKSIKSIAKILHVHENVIRRFLIESGLELRPLDEVNRLRMVSIGPEGIRRARIKAAKGREGKTFKQITGIGEAELAGRLEAIGIPIVIQKAEGTFNIDVAIPDGMIAVEIFGGGAWTRTEMAKRFRDRSRFLHERGWITVVIRFNKRYGIRQGAIDFILDLKAKRLMGLLPDRKTWIIRSDGEPITAIPGKECWRSIILGA